MDWKRIPVVANYYGTLPYRLCANAVDCRRGRAPVMIVFYHRVADSHPNKWTISRDLFARQVRWMLKHVDLISLTEAQDRIRSGRNGRPAVTITFDDGYAENCSFALPLLISKKIPCTYFVSLGHVVDQQPFAHDIQAGQPLLPNTIQQLRDLAAQGIEIGAHTRTHADLGNIHNEDQLYDEIAVAGQELQAAVESTVRSFAFPYGQRQNMTVAALRMARDAGYDAVCSAYGGYNFPGGDAFQLQRIHADPEMARFINWLTVDRRKTSISPPFSVDAPTDEPAPFVGECA